MRVGTDIIEISRIIKAFKNENSLMRVFTQNEIEYAFKFKNAYEHLAGFLCAKESVVKALKTGLISEVEVLHAEDGAPYLSLSGSLKKEFEKKYTSIDVSISHCKNYATSVVIVS